MVKDSNISLLAKEAKDLSVADGLAKWENFQADTIEELQKYADYAATFGKDGGTVKQIAISLPSGEVPLDRIAAKLESLKAQGFVVRILNKRASYSLQLAHPTQ